MSLILNIESSSKNCSVAVAREGVLLSCVELKSEQYVHSEKLHVFIEDCLRKVGLTVPELDAVAVSEGPGSYTGLRIGVSAAKGIAYSLSIPLISISSLVSLCLAAKQKGVKGFLAPMIDARRMEVYTCLYDESINPLSNIFSAVVEENQDVFLKKISCSFFGDGAEKCISSLPSNYTYVEGVELSARNMVMISYEKYLGGEFENTAYFEPFYLKEFIPGKMKKVFNT